MIHNEILTNMLKSANLTKASCSKLLNTHKNSLDSYIYKFNPSGEFPPSFAYFFLNAISTSFLPLYKNSKKKGKKGKFEFFKEIDHSHLKNFFKIISENKNLSVEYRLIMPCLQHHILALVKISNFENIHYQDLLLNEYVEAILPDYLNEIEMLDEYQYTEEQDERFSNFHINRIEGYKMEVEAIKNFFPILEILRKHYMKNFVAPHETFRLPVLNSKKKILFSKDFLNRNLNLNKYQDLVLMNVEDDNMQGTFNKNDIALIIKFHNKILPKIFKDGVYALNMNNEIIIRRLQFLEFKIHNRVLVNIISDNKKYSDQKIPLEELKMEPWARLDANFGLKVASQLDQVRESDNASSLESVYGEFLEIFLQRLDFQTASNLIERIDLSQSVGFDQFSKISAQSRTRGKQNGTISMVLETSESGGAALCSLIDLMVAALNPFPDSNSGN